MKKRLVIFLVGAIMLVISLPTSTKMVMELIHNQKMSLHYNITNESGGFPPSESTYNFKDHTVEIEETIKDVEGYLDPWQNKMAIGDLSLILDGVEIDTLKDYPIRVLEEGLNRYYGEIAYFTLEDKKVNETQFIILLKKTRELEKEMPNGDIVGWVPPEKLKYTQYTLDEGGNLKNKNFSFSERDALQTELLNAGAVGPYRIGYYTDAWETYPSIFFPLIFPFLTLIVGFLLVIAVFLSVLKKYIKHTEGPVKSSSKS
ncbi:MAG: hypothetical protein RR651_14210 [Lysinibacillus sp.]